jgi:ATP-dependent exoDNAse (exonuclease V) alpha subunit
VASYHISVKPIGRAKGRSATGSAAYRAATRIRDERTGEVWDFRRKRGVLHREMVLPPDAPAWAGSRVRLWNAAEAAEKRKNATVGREFEIALPAELGPRERQQLAVGFARELVKRHGFAADVVLHAPHRLGNGLNFHAHILCSTRRLNANGFGEKTRELDDLNRGRAEVKRWRERWAEVQNQALAERGHVARVDHRTLQAQGAEREPTRHKGPAITAMERRGIETEVGERLREEQRREMQARLERAAELGRLERETREVGRSILDVSSDIAAAARARDELVREKAAERVRAVAREAWERRRAAREKQLEKGRDHGAGLELDEELRVKRARSRDGPEFG